MTDIIISSSLLIVIIAFYPHLMKDFTNCYLTTCSRQEDHRQICILFIQACLHVYFLNYQVTKSETFLT